jgi:hypothetical protein
MKDLHGAKLLKGRLAGFGSNSHVLTCDWLEAVLHTP